MKEKRTMTDMNDREKAFETKSALDQEVMFRIEARACKLFGLWLADKLGITGDEAKVFAGSVVSSNLDEPGFEDVKRTVRPVIAEKGLELSEADIDAKLMHFMEEARVQIMDEKNQ
jgi:hypothetical protein